MTTLEIGQKIPDLMITTNQGTKPISTYLGKNIILYFYPKDSTPGCTIEAKDFRDLHSKFKDENTIILGVSRDSLPSHQKFIDKHNIPFELISDQDESLCKAFDVLKMKNLFGKKYLGIVRSTFLIDQHGILHKAWRNVKVLGHAKKVLAELSKTQ